MNAFATGLLVVLFGGLCLTLLVAVHRRNVAAAVNALTAIATAVLSVSLAAGFQLPWDTTPITPVFPLWVTIAGLLHSIGMLGPYESIWWWDHLTHTVSAALVAALLYAGLIVVVPALSPLALAIVTVVYTLAVGVFWELIELVARAVGERYDIEPVLVYYGWRDTAFDLVFDLVGAVLIVALDVRLFVHLVARASEITRVLLVWTTSVLVVGSVLMLLFLGVTSFSGDQW